MDAENLFTHWIGLAVRKTELLAALHLQLQDCLDDETVRVAETNPLPLLCNFQTSFKNLDSDYLAEVAKNSDSSLQDAPNFLKSWRLQLQDDDRFPHFDIPDDRNIYQSVINVLQTLSDGLAHLDSISPADLRIKLEHAFQVLETSFEGESVKSSGARSNVSFTTTTPN